MTLDRSIVIGVCGAGAMGAGIAQIAAQAGHQTIVLDRDETALTRGRSGVEKSLAGLVARGKITGQEAQATGRRIVWALDIEELAKAGLVIEAIVEDEAAKRALFGALEEGGTEAVLATNTSSLSVTRLADGLRRPGRFLGLHFFNPAPAMKLVEIIPGAATDVGLVAAAEALMRLWGKEPVVARDVPGFIVNRVARPFYSEGWRALEEGAADAATIDFLFRDLAGFRMGPLELGDLIGHDVNSAVARSIHEAYFGRTRFAPSLMQASLAASGKLGRKTGAGVYDYHDDAPPPAPAFAPAHPAPKDIRFGPLTGPLQLLCGAPGASDNSTPAGFASLDGALVGFADGWPASAYARDFGRPVALLDYVDDPAAAAAIAFSASDETARLAARAYAAAAGKKAVELFDRPGLVVLRTLLQLANAAADAVRDRVGEASGIDRAMRFGANYPYGPLAWVQSFGFARAVEALDAISKETGEPMYRACEYLRAEARKQV